jgi:2-dehydropantoate 2-reductase
MRIAVLGVGKIGSAFAFRFARDGRHEVTVVARPESTRLRQLLATDAVVNTKGERARVRVMDALDEEEYDLVIVTLLAHQVGSVLPQLVRSKAASVLCMFVNFEPQRLQDAIGADRCSFGMPFIQATIDENGKLNATIGAMGQKTIISEPRWVDLFDSVGLPAKVEPNMLLWLRCHVPLTVAFESVSVAAIRRGGTASWDDAMVLARGVHECFALLRRLGYEVYPAGKKRIESSPHWVFAFILWFLSRIAPFRDLLATGKDECRALVDVMLAAAASSKPPVRVERIQGMKP